MTNLAGNILLNRYQVLELVGRGGMAEVYRVWDQERAALLALKLLREDLAQDRVFLRRFKREAQTLAKLQHPNIVRFYGLEQDELLAFMLMDFVTGTSLRAEIFRLQGASMAGGRVRTILEPVSSALHYAHRSGIVHCDLKPGNVMIEDTGRVLVTDFGIARLSDAATATMVGLGTPAYMAPEQVRGLDPTPQTDIYALGVVLFEMLTGGERPFTGEEARTTGSTSEKVRWEQVHLEPPPPRKYNPDISPELEALVFKCLAKEPGERYQSALELLNALELALGDAAIEEPALPEVEAPLQPSPIGGEPFPVPVAQPAPRVPPMASRSLPWGWIGGLGALVVAILLLIVFGVGNGGPGRSATQTTMAGATIRTETAEALAILRNDTPSRHATITLPTATNTEEPTSSPSPTPLPAQIVDDFDAPMALVPAGAFQMGSEAGGIDESPVHEVYLDDFYIDQYEVTNAQLAECVDARKCEQHDCANYGDAQYADHPVGCMGWLQADNYCKWRDARLPTEAEWEKAARGGLEGALFPWGDQVPVSKSGVENGAKYGYDAGRYETGTEPGGSYTSNGYGLYDMAGNVWEWVADWYDEDYYANSPAANPDGASTGEYRILRGGSWSSSLPTDLRVAYRLRYLPTFNLKDFGFRCARSFGDRIVTNIPETPRPETTGLVPEETLTPEPDNLPEQIVDDFGVPMALITMGEFQMGSKEGRSNEQPVHNVILSDFLIDVYEVTNNRYAKCVQAGVCDPPGGRHYKDTGYTDHPVVYVDWFQAQAYCEWRGARLPTEAEWEKAARGGIEGAKYPWGNDSPICVAGTKNGAQSTDCGYDTVAVGTFKPNTFGIYDMAGNVWEWVSDWYDNDYYTHSQDENPQGPKTGTERVLRSGCYGNPYDFLRVAYRRNSEPTLSAGPIGFRCARSVESTVRLSKTDIPTLEETEGSPASVATPEATPTITPSPMPLTVQTTDAFGVPMALVPAGEFEMGNITIWTFARSARSVHIDAFNIDVYEVTNAHFAKCVQAGACGPPPKVSSSTRSKYYGNPDFDDYPVININWFKAQAYCAWRGARLPTEAEWEKAARGGLDGKTYSWGDEQTDKCSRANVEDCHDDTVPVGSYPPNGYGLYDVTGNVWEWVADWYPGNLYEDSPGENPTGPSSGQNRVHRGGSWGDSGSALRVAFNSYGDPSVAYQDTGFRCARSP